MSVLYIYILGKVKRMKLGGIAKKRKERKYVWRQSRKKSLFAVSLFGRKSKKRKKKILATEYSRFDSVTF